MLKQRILTAIVLITAVVAGIIYLPVNAFALITAALLALGALEWARLAGVCCVLQKALYTLGFLLLVLLLWLNPVWYVKLSVLAISALTWLGIAMWVMRYPAGQSIWTAHVLVRLMLGWLYLVPCWLALLVVRMRCDDGIALIFLLLIAVWSTDTGAYFAGRFLGRKPLAPQLSPKKTQEGVYGGLLSALVLGLGYGWMMHERLFVSWELQVVLVLMVALLSVLGDLFESMIKRMAGVKDSGALLPGHGGVLDRLDGLIAAAPLFALGLVLLANQGWC